VAPQPHAVEHRRHRVTLHPEQHRAVITEQPAVAAHVGEQPRFLQGQPSLHRLLA
jgi:hypothetical protein